jgi:hypothetical protein
MTNHEDDEKWKTVLDEEDKWWNEMCEWLDARMDEERDDWNAQLERLIYWDTINEQLYQEEEELSAMCEPDYEEEYWECVIQQYIEDSHEYWR